MPSYIVFTLYIATAIWLIAGAYRINNQGAMSNRLLGLGLGVLGLVTHTYMLSHAVLHSSMALNVTDTASLIAWIIAIITISSIWKRPRFNVLGGVLLVLVAVLALITDEGARSFVTGQSGFAITAHIISSVLAYALITVGAALAIALALLEQRLRHRKALGWLNLLPSIEALESGLFQAIGSGFVLLSFALFSGFIFVQNLLAQHLVHKTILSILAWIILATLMIGRWRFGWRGRVAIRWTLSGFIMLGLAYFGSKWVLESLLGRHWG